MAFEIAVSFVHGYSDLDQNVERDELPALWVVGEQGKTVMGYPFPRNVSDFERYSDVISGQHPLANASDFKKLPRFGLTGLVEFGDNLYAGSWNGVYEIGKTDKALKRIITNQFMSDLHGIWVGDDCIITILTGKDVVVLSDFSGRVIDYFSVAPDLTVFKEDAVGDVDWRFISKQFRGATGLWHINYVQKFGDEIWLTARNLGAFIVVDLRSRKAHLRTMNQKTTVLLHDGVLHKGEYFFTSIDGKIIIAAEPQNARANPREEVEGVERFSRDLICELIRLEDTEFGREPNWCRGIACRGDQMYVTVDGRYDSDLSFGLLGLDRQGKKVREERLRWETVGPSAELRYVTGFDVATYDV
jgi:hypothetical protein